jgi:hypothetical protein
MRHSGVGPRVARAILAEPGDARRLSSSRQSVHFAGLHVTVQESDHERRPGQRSRQGPPLPRGRLSRPPNRRASPPRPTTPATRSSSSARKPTAPCSRSRATCCAALTTPRINSTTTPCRPPPEAHLSPAARATPPTTDNRGRLPTIDAPPPPTGRDWPKRKSALSADPPYQPTCRRAPARLGHQDRTGTRAPRPAPPRARSHTPPRPAQHPEPHHRQDKSRTCPALPLRWATRHLGPR